MKRITALLFAAWLVCAVSVGAEGHAFGRAQVCDGEHMAMVNGVYTTCATLQWSGTNTFTNMDAWSPDSHTQQTMDARSLSIWDATFTDTSTSNQRVVSYPDSEDRFTTYDNTCNHQPTISTLTHFSYTTQESTPLVSSGAWDQAYDVYVGDSHCATPHQEIMVWDRYTAGTCGTTASFTTADGVAYDVCWSTDSPASYIQVRRHTQIGSNVENVEHLGQIFGHLNNITTSYGPLVSTAAQLQFVQYGTEFVNPTPAGGMTIHNVEFVPNVN